MLSLTVIGCPRPPPPGGGGGPGAFNDPALTFLDGGATADQVRAQVLPDQGPELIVQALTWPSPAELAGARVATDEQRDQAMEWLAAAVAPAMLPAGVRDAMIPLARYGSWAHASDTAAGYDRDDVFLVRYVAGGLRIQIMESQAEVVVALADDRAAQPVANNASDRLAFVTRLAGAALTQAVQPPPTDPWQAQIIGPQMSFVDAFAGPPPGAGSPGRFRFVRIFSDGRFATFTLVKNDAGWLDRRHVVRFN